VFLDFGGECSRLFEFRPELDAVTLECTKQDATDQFFFPAAQNNVAALCHRKTRSIDSGSLGEVDLSQTGEFTQPFQFLQSSAPFNNSVVDIYAEPNLQSLRI